MSNRYGCPYSILLCLAKWILGTDPLWTFAFENDTSQSSSSWLSLQMWMWQQMKLPSHVCCGMFSFWFFKRWNYAFGRGVHDGSLLFLGAASNSSCPLTFIICHLLRRTLSIWAERQAYWPHLWNTCGNIHALERIRLLLRCTRRSLRVQRWIHALLFNEIHESYCRSCRANCRPVLSTREMKEHWSMQT